MKINALIGYTGFIGSNLKKNFNFKKFYNSKNILKIKNHNFNLIVCSGTHSKIWWAKKYPNQDYKKIVNLIKNLKAINAEKFILISTIEVYGKNNKKKEYDKISINKKNTSYSNNRIILENFVKKKFKNYYIIRLPIVYGENFKKNSIYDLLNNNDVHKLNGNDLLQIYNVKNLTKDIKFILKKKLKIVNICPEPIKLSLIAKKIFNLKIKKNKKFRKMSMQSIYKKFKISKNQTLKDLNLFCKKYAVNNI